MSSAILASPLDFKSIALPLAQRGIHVVPTDRGLSMPILPRWQEIATTNPVTIEAWGTNGHTHSNCVSIAKIGGVGMIEIDDYEAALRRGMPLLAATFTAQSPGGEGHFHAYFQHTAESNALAASVGWLKVKEGDDCIAEFKGNNAACCSPGSYRMDDKYPAGAWYTIADDSTIVPFQADVIAWFAANGKGKAKFKGDRRELHEDFDPAHLIEHYKLDIDHEYEKDGAQWHVARTCLVDGTQHTAQVASRKCCLITGGEAGVGLKCWHNPEMTWGTLRAKLEEGGIEPYPHHIFADEEPGHYSDKWPGGIEHLPPPKEAAASTGDTVSPEELAAFLAKPSVPSWERLAALMQQVRLGLQPGENGRVRPKPRLQVEKEVWEFALRAIERRGSLFVDAYPFIFLSDETKIVKFHNSGEANALLSRLGLLVTQSHTNLVRENLSQHILLHGTPTHIEKLGCMRGEAVYVNDGRGGMFKVTANEITEEENGTDDVYMLCPELTPWPELSDENAFRLDSIRMALAAGGGKVGPTALCRHFNAYFEEGALSSDQYQQLVLLRYLSLFVGNAIDLHPPMFALGEQNSGKSTLWEKIKWLLEGTRYESTSLPTNLRSFTAAVTNQSMCIFDNIDSVNFENPKSDYPAYVNMMCKASTGGKVSIAELYKTNVENTFDLRCDLFFTARVNPFPADRSDLGRRTLYFPIRMPEAHEYRSTELMKKQLREDEAEMKLETLARLQMCLGR